MIKHYEGELGTFDYDDEEFEIEYNIHGDKIHYIGKGLSVDLPDGCIDTSYMFEDCILPEGFTLGNFNTYNVVNMHYMFKDCVLPEGFSLGDNFSTYNVKDMSGMFSNCVLPENFTLGDYFDASNVVDIDGMFLYCALPKGFSLGAHLTHLIENVNIECFMDVNFLKV